MAVNITRKVRYGSSASVVTGLVTWVLVTYVFKNRTDLPLAVAYALPAIVSTVLGFATAWWTKHAPADLQLPVVTPVASRGRTTVV